MKAIQVQDLGRVQEIARVLARNGFGHVFHLAGLGNVLPSVVDGEEPTKPYARRLRQALVDLGPAYVKFGQILSVRPDILPKDVLVEFQTLQDKVPPMPFSDVEQVIASELGQPMFEIFSEFDEESLGSASIAQVHRARLKTGREVAVKLQRPGIERIIRSDLHILYSLARAMEGRVKIPGFYTPVDIIREFDDAITRELNFLTEARSAERMRNNFRDDANILIPEVLHTFTTRRLLVLELVKGRPLKEVMSERDPGRLERSIAHRYMDATYRQVFDHGFFHGDPHPGNVFVTEDGRLAYLDFGMTGLLTGAMQDTIISAFTSLVFRDAETLAMTVYRAGATNEQIKLREFREEIERLMVKYHGASLDDLATPTTLVEVVQVSAKYRINLPSEYAILARAIGLVEGAVRVLLPGVDIVTEVAPYAQRLMRQRFSPERVAADAAKLMLVAQTQFKDLPTHFNQTLVDLEAGNIAIITKDPDAEALRQEIAQGSLRIGLAALAATTSLGGFLFLAAWSPQPFGIPLFGIAGLAMCVAGMGVFGALGLHVFFARLLSLSFWRRRFLDAVRFFWWRRPEE